jgi:hypothetical protein
MTIREYTNRECDEARFTPAEAVRRYTAEEQSLLDGLEAARAKFKREIEFVPRGAMKGGVTYSLLTRSEMSREALKDREKIAEKRKDAMCVNGCGILATKYRDLGICTRCYRKYLKARKEAGKY